MGFGNSDFGFGEFGGYDFVLVNQSPAPSSIDNPRLFAIQFNIISSADPLDLATLGVYAADVQLIQNGAFIGGAYGTIDASNPTNVRVVANLPREISSSHIDVYVAAKTTGLVELHVGSIWSFDTINIQPSINPKIINFLPTPGSNVSATQTFTFTIKSQSPIDYGSVFINFNNEIAVDGYTTDPNYTITNTLNIDGYSADYIFTPNYSLPTNVFINFQISCLDINGLRSEPFIASFVVASTRPRLLTPVYPLDRQINVPVNATIHFLLNKLASPTGLDVTTLDVKINGANAIIDGYFQSGFDGYFSNINPGVTDFDYIEVVINQSPLLFNATDIVTVAVTITSLDPVTYSTTFSFITEDLQNSSLTTPPTPVFAGYFQGIYLAGSLGDGYHAHLTWHPARTTRPNYDLAYIIYYSQTRSDVFSEGPKLTTVGMSLPKPETIPGTDAQLYGFYTDLTMPVGTEYYYAVRATEFPHTAVPVVPPDGYSSFATGLTVVDGYNFAVPAVAQLLNSIPVSGGTTVTMSFTPGYATLGGYLNVNGEVMRYTSASTTMGITTFFVMSSGRGQFDSGLVEHFPGEPVGPFLGNIDDNSVVAQTVVHWEDYNRFNPHRTRPDLETTNFTLEDGYNASFEPYDYCGWHTARIDTLLNGGDCKSYIGGNFGGYKNFNIYDQMLGREEMLLEATGEPVILLKRIWSGEKCPCVLSRRESSRVRTCSLCYGTGFAGGYAQYLNPRRIDTRIMLRFDPAEEDLQSGAQAGLAQDYKPVAWTIAVPAVKDRDIIVRFDQYGFLDFAYEVLHVSRVKNLFGQWERQKVSLQRLDKTHVIYQYKPATVIDGYNVGSPSMNLQQGIVSFAGASMANVTLPVPYADAGYSLSLTVNSMVAVSYSNKTATGFTITANAPFSGSVSWETAHF